MQVNEPTPSPRPRTRRVTILRLASLAGLTAVAAACGIRGVPLATPFTDHAYSEATGTVAIGVTNATLDPKNRAAFDDHTRRVIRSLPTHDGYLGHSVRGRVLGNEVWTMTVWRDQAALDAFVASPVHRTAIREGLGGVNEARFLRFDWPAAERPPSWRDITERLRNVTPIDYAAKRTASQSSSYPR